MKKKVILVVALLLCAFPLHEKGESRPLMTQQQGELINVTVQEVWDMLHSEEDGIQYVVDVRTFEEYANERIATPHLYDKPILYPLQLIEQPLFAKIFIILFNGKEVILYCRSANRSNIAGHILLDAGFSGVLYNMLGGINEWKAEGFPTVSGFGFGG